MEDFFNKVSSYAALSAESKKSWLSILKRKKYEQGSFFVQEGDVPRSVAFVSYGLFSQYSTSNTGDIVIKRFFSEGYFAASTPAMLKREPGKLTIEALEDSMVYEYDFWAFKDLVKQHRDISEFYIHYMELHWIIEKESLEISLRQDVAKIKYKNFLRDHPNLGNRLKQHQVASYLGITPTQLSRVRAELNYR